MRLNTIASIQSRRLRALIPFGLYGVVSLLFCAPLFAPPNGVGVSDWDQHLFYYGSVLKSVVEYGQFPFWNPWYCGGNVLWQNPQVALLSPVYPLSLFLSLALAMKINIVLHYWLGFIGMHLLLKRAIGLSFFPLVFYLAALVTLSGATALHLSVGHSWVLAACYLPLVCFLFFRAVDTGAVRLALSGGAVMALNVYNGGFQIVPIAVAGIGVFAVLAAVLQQRWRPVVLALALGAASFLYAAPRLLPEMAFVSSESFRVTRWVDDQPDRMSGEMLLRAYLDPSQDRRLRLPGQRHSWHEYGNYIGAPAAVLLIASLGCVLAYQRQKARWLGLSLALTSVALFTLSAGEFSPFAPASLAKHAPFFSHFRIPSRYSMAFLLFGACTIAWAARAMAAKRTFSRRASVVTAVLCVLASADVVVRNQSQFQGVFSQPPIDRRFHLLKGPATLETSAAIDPSAPGSPMLRALMDDRASDNCFGNFQLLRGADPEDPLVFTDGNSEIFETTFSPRRIAFAVAGGNQPSRVVLNQNYSDGWRSGAGPVTVDPQDRRPAVTLDPGETGKFAFTFVPPGLALGTALLVLGIVGSVFVWRRRIPVAGPADVEPGVIHQPDDRIRRAVEVVLILIGVGCLLFVIPHDVSGDGRVRFDALSRLLEQGYLSRTAHSLVGPLFSTPLYYAGKLVAGPLWWCGRYNALLLAAGLAATVGLLRKTVDGQSLRIFCLLILAASTFPGQVQDYFGDVFTAVCVLVGIAALMSDHPRLGWTAMIVGVANSPATIVGMLLVALRRVARSRRLRHLVPVALAALLIIAESWIRRGGPFVSGYEGNAGARTVMPYSGLPEFSYPLFLGVLSITLSFGKGLLFFAPGLLLVGRRGEPVPERLIEACRYGMWFLAGVILVYAKWWAWYGGWVWGPRFFLVAAIPASLAMAIRLRQLPTLGIAALGALLAILTLSAWVGLNGAVFGLANLRVCTQGHYALEFLCWYAPEFSPLWRPFVAPLPLSWRQELFIVYSCGVYVWLAAPVFKTLLMRASVPGSAYWAEARTWRF